MKSNIFNQFSVVAIKIFSSTMTSNIYQSNFLTAFKVITPAHLEVLDPVVGADAASGVDAVNVVVAVVMKDVGCLKLGLNL